MKASKMFNLPTLTGIAVAIALATVLVGCGKHKEPGFVYMPDMWYSPAFKAQEPGSNRMPVKGTVPRGYQPYGYLRSNDGPGKELKNPVIATADVLARGQALYNTYCIVCHGDTGMGNGPVSAKFGIAPSFHTDKIRGWPDANIYHVITVGQARMPSYAAQVAAGDRWAIIHYIRALQRSQNPSAQDISAAEGK